MATFRIVSSEIVYHDIIIEAENKEEAIDKALDESAIGWNNCGYGDFQIDKCEEVTE